MKKIIFLTLLITGISNTVGAQNENRTTAARPLHNADSATSKPVKDGTLSGPKPKAPNQGNKPTKDSSLTGPKPGSANQGPKPDKDGTIQGPKTAPADKPTGKPIKDSLKGTDPKKSFGK